MRVEASEMNRRHTHVGGAWDSLWQVAQETLETLRATPPRTFGLVGTVGDAIFACELARMGADVPTNVWLSRAINSFKHQVAGSSLHRGLAGLGLLLASYADAPEILAEIDALLLASLPLTAAPSLQSGVAGIAIYASLRCHTSTGLRLQDASMLALQRAATSVSDGVLWRTSREYAESRGMDVPVEPITELGVMHGIAGTLVGLSALAACGREDARELARDGLRAAWAWERPGSNRFGRVMFGADGKEATREFDGRWCVGDPGVLRALWLTANAVGDVPSASRALARLRDDALRAATGPLPGVSGRVDLCCGCGSIAHVYRRMYLDSGDRVFDTTSRRLFEACAPLIREVKDPSFIYGRAGALLATLSQGADDYRWDAILGIGLPLAFRRER